jgi:malate synthase
VPLAELQAMLDAPRQTEDANGQAVPSVGSGLVDSERALLQSRGLLNAAGKITPAVIRRESLDAPEKLLNQERWDAIYSVPKGDITIEHIQHAFYMAANYGFQILNGNFAAAIDDYELKQRFMNDLATYRIDVSWLWTLCRHQAVITKDGYLQRAKLTEDGMVLAPGTEAVKAGTRFTRNLFQKVFDYHSEWTAQFFAELDRMGDPGRFDRSKASIIMELLQRQLLSPKYIQHSARVLFVLAEADDEQRAQILDAIFHLSREEVVQRVKEGAMPQATLVAHDYVYDIFAG